jgi:hypothetical protein
LAPSRIEPRRGIRFRRSVTRSCRSPRGPWQA